MKSEQVRFTEFFLYVFCIHFLFPLILYIIFANFFNYVVPSDQPFCIPRNIRLRELWHPRGKRQRSSDCHLSRSCQLRYRYQLQTIGHFHTVQLNPSGSSAKDHPAAMAYLIYGTSFAH